MNKYRAAGESLISQAAAEKDISGQLVRGLKPPSPSGSGSSSSCKFAVLGLLAAGTLLVASAFATPPSKGVQVVADEAQRRVDITIDGEPFTSYIWPTNLKKPVLYPIIDSDGVTLT